MTEGPLLETLTRRLAECPADFLAAPNRPGGVWVAAVVSDVLQDLGGAALTPAQAAHFTPPASAKADNWLRWVLLAAWLLHADWFLARRQFAPLAQTFLAEGLTELARVVRAPLGLSDPDRREELARLGLRALDLCPAGETPAQAQDRLSTLDSIERQQVVRAARAAEARAQAIREAMAKKAAQEAADKWTRE